MTHVRFLHTSDWQLGMTRHYLEGEAQSRYTGDRVETIRRIGELARARGWASVVCSVEHPIGDPRNEGDHVIIDDFAAGRELAQHLRALGHDRIDVLVESMTASEPRN